MTTLVAVMLVLTACKKDKALLPQKEEIVITGLPGWGKEADLILKSEVMLSDEDYERIKKAIGGIEVKFTIGNILQTLPYSTTNNDPVITYYYKWEGKKLTIYRQKNQAEPVNVLIPKPGDVQLVFYVLK